MSKVLNTVFFVSFTASAMIAPPPSPANSMGVNPEMLAKIKQLVGQEIQSINYDAKYSSDHVFEIGELVAIPRSKFWGTYDVQLGLYGQVEGVADVSETQDFISLHEGWRVKHVKEITVSYGTQEFPFEKKTEEAKYIGKLSQEAIQRALKTITTQAKATRK